MIILLHDQQDREISLRLKNRAQYTFLDCRNKHILLKIKNLTLGNEFFYFNKKINPKILKLTKAKKINIEIKHWIDPNLGDAINEYIFRYFICDEETSFKNPKNNKYDIVKVPLDKKCQGKLQGVVGCGSILEWAMDEEIVFGSGIQYYNSKIKLKNMNNIISLRGPKTLKFVQDQKTMPNVPFGDPALLLPFIYPIPQNIQKKYKIGIIPHFKEYNYASNYIKSKNIKLISIRCLYSFNDFKNFIKQICECEIIFSSSLHGIIFSDVYGIQAHTIEITDYFYQKQCGFFKFEDYYESVGRKFIKYKFQDVIQNKIMPASYNIKIDVKNLILNFPYISPEVKKRCLQKIKAGNV